MVADDSIMKTIKNRSSMEMNKTMKSVIKSLALVRHCGHVPHRNACLICANRR